MNEEKNVLKDTTKTPVYSVVGTCAYCSKIGTVLKTKQNGNIFLLCPFHDKFYDEKTETIKVPLKPKIKRRFS